MNAYEEVASEYYNNQLHPTCANLRDASRRGLSLLARAFFAEGEYFCEVGCGAGILAGMPGADRRFIIGIDVSPGMLRHATGTVAVADVMRLPFPAGTFAGVFGSLADPYNTPPFYRESWRVLGEGGRLLFSVPDVQWVRHNQEQEGVSDSVAVLRLKDGSSVALPSHVYDHQAQIDMLSVAGFREIQCRPIAWKNTVDPGSISHRFRDRSGALVSEAIVTMYLAVK